MKFKDFWATKAAKIPKVRSYRDQSAQARKTGQPTGMTNGEDHDTIEQELSFNNKSVVEKPGPSIHTSKWDECVADVKSKNPGANAYAVCTSQLGDESFKSEFRGLAYTKSLIKNAKREMAKDVGVGFAGAVPNSLLARQDLEGTKIRTTKSDKASNDKLYQLKDDAAYAETETEKKSVVTDIKDTQKKRQKAAINMREKSFKDVWKNELQKDQFSDAKKKAKQLISQGKSKDEVVAALKREFDMDYGQAEYAYNDAK